MSLYPRINYDDIIRQIEGAQKKANDANLARYQELLAHIDSLGQQVGSAGTYGQAESYIQNIGNAARQRIGETGIQQKGLADQDLISRGLGNTTIRTSAMRGIASDTERQMQSADEMEMTAKAGLMERRAGLETDIGKLKASAIEGRYDKGPDMSMYANLLQAASAGQTSPVTATVSRSPGPVMFGSSSGASGGSSGGFNTASSGGGGNSGSGARVIYGGSGAPTYYDAKSQQATDANGNPIGSGYYNNTGWHGTDGSYRSTNDMWISSMIHGNNQPAAPTAAQNAAKTAADNARNQALGSLAGMTLGNAVLPGIGGALGGAAGAGLAALYNQFRR
jgi:hypothetical protein